MKLLPILRGLNGTYKNNRMKRLNGVNSSEVKLTVFIQKPFLRCFILISGTIQDIGGRKNEEKE